MRKAREVQITVVVFLVSFFASFLAGAALALLSDFLSFTGPEAPDAGQRKLKLNGRRRSTRAFGLAKHIP